MKSVEYSCHQNYLDILTTLKLLQTNTAGFFSLFSDFQPVFSGYKVGSTEDSQQHLTTFWTMCQLKPECWNVLLAFAIFLYILSSNAFLSIYDANMYSTCAFCGNCVSMLPQTLIPYIAMEFLSPLALKRAKWRDHLKAVTPITFTLWIYRLPPEHIHF